MHGSDSSYLVGELVRVRDDLWRVADVQRYRACQALRLTGAGIANRGADRTLLAPFDRPSRIAPRTRPQRVSRRRLLAAIAGAAAAHAPWGGCRAAVEARIDLYPYQLEPALAVLRGLATRVLLADEVGLGKTVQAGLILGELVRRGDVARALVLTPAGLRQQWAEELARCFGIEAAIADASWLRQATLALPRGLNPWSTERVLIASYDFIKRPAVVHALESLIWDLLIVDEAHATAGESDRRLAVGGLAQRARRVVLLTATPHTGDERAFAALRDQGRLGGRDADPIVMFRRTRAEVGLDARRRTRVVAVRLTDREHRMHRLLERYTRLVWREAAARGDRDALLAMMVLRKRALSSAASLASSIDRRLAWLADAAGDRALQLALPLEPDGETDREDDEPEESLAAPGLADRARERVWLGALAGAAHDAAARESKMAALVRLLRRTREPAIVFTEYRDTLQQIERAVAPLARVVLLHGGLTREERASAARALNNGEARILLATDTGSEGLNLQARCRWVVNFELPWSPARLEQRAGRVDRIGQTRVPHASHLIARDTAESLVLMNLIARVARIKRALGDRAGPAPVMPEAAVARVIVGGARLAREDPAGPEAPDGRFAVAPALAADAAREARRLADIRRLAQLGRGDRAPHGAMAAEADGPVIGRLRGRGRRRAHRGDGHLLPGLVVLVGAALVDADGHPVDSLLVPAHIPLDASSPLHGPGPFALVGRLVEAARDALTPAIERQLVSRLAAIGAVHRESLARLMQREALLGEAAGQPLARRLVQPGLFDRRAIRRSETDRAVAEAQVRGVEAKLRDLEVARALRPGNVELIAGLVLG